MDSRHRNCYDVTCGDVTPRMAWNLNHAKAVAKDLVHWMGGVARVTDMSGKVIGTASERNGKITYRATR